MPTRFNTQAKINFGQTPLSTGYEKPSSEVDITIPSCGIEDVDSAMFNLFDKEIALMTGKNGDLKKVPVIFAAGEKWAMLKRGRPLRDRNNTLILPLVTIMRTELVQSMSDDVIGRGINQQHGEFVIRRKLDKSDRSYQNLINKYLLLNQQNAAVRDIDSQNDAQATTERKLGSLYDTRSGVDMTFLSPNLLNNVYETLVVPSPQFYTAKYQVTIWSQYMQHSNQILEKLFSTFLPQAQSWRLDTPKGYWFVAKLEDGGMTTETNFDDMSQSERFVKNVLEITVPAYFFASSAPGIPLPVKRYVSCPIIKFEADSPDIFASSEQTDSKYVLGSDDPTLPLSVTKNNRRDQREIGQYYVTDTPEGGYKLTNSSAMPSEMLNPNDPAYASLNRGYTIRVTSRNAKGETTYKGANLDGLDIVFSSDK